ncbi:MAG: sporulation protein [Ruminococcus sp.]|nr:sporulation protein [Ruminococcus sp.]
MDNKSFKKAASMIAAGALAVFGTIAGTVYAEDTTVSSHDAALTTAAESSTAAVTEMTTAPAEQESDEEINWYKAELDSYDDSLSLISYESSPESSGKGKKKGPTPVELNVTGGYVGDIPWFESEPVIEAQPGKFAVVTYGWGHGVGMSQNGANFYATYSGWTYQDILFHYYPDTYLMDTGEAYDEEITVAGVSGDVLSMVSQIVFNEVGSSMNYEAIKAQAVAVYTYCKYNGNDASDLRCKPCPPQVVVDAVSEVLGQALYYDGDYALTMFSASSGGITANCDEVFWRDLPYLRSVPSDYDAAYDPHYGTVTYIDDYQLRNMIEAAYGITLSSDPYNWIKPEYSDETGYVTYVNIDDQLTVKGYEFKLAIGLKSSKFNIHYTPRPEGEAIPNGSSDIVVVEPEYTETPGVWYPNNEPTDIGAVIPEVTEPTTDPTIEETWTEPSTDWYEQPTWTDTTESWTDTTTSWTDNSYDYNYNSGYDYSYDYNTNYNYGY